MTQVPQDASEPSQSSSQPQFPALLGELIKAASNPITRENRDQACDLAGRLASLALSPNGIAQVGDDLGPIYRQLKISNMPCASRVADTIEILFRAFDLPIPKPAPLFEDAHGLDLERIVAGAPTVSNGTHAVSAY